ncbi:substrate binding domain-containing protein [Rhizobium sp. YK2]|uniref:substrate binding domain-containing protein n=1 Tax=Rhizobium sp. YK2 TaxID=1860096 RepID=UPI0024782CA2|nr:substrate binding domain-containing protein [Rhizobium sp. YK2]
MTDAGRHLFERAQRLLDELADTHAEVAAFDSEVSGTVRIACFPTFGKRYVIPVLASLAQQYPRLHVELDLTERLADPVAERLDLVVRMGELSDSTLIATKLAAHDRILVASPAYLDEYGVPQSEDALRNHRLLDKLHGNDLLGWSSILGASTAEVCENVVFRSDDLKRSTGLPWLGWVWRSCRAGYRDLR